MQHYKSEIVHSLTTSVSSFRQHLCNVEGTLANCDLLIATEFTDNVVQFFSRICSSAQKNPLVVMLVGDPACSRTRLLSDILFVPQFENKLDKLLNERFVRFVYSTITTLKIYRIKSDQSNKNIPTDQQKLSQLEERKVFEKSLSSVSQLVNTVDSFCRNNDVDLKTLFEVGLPSPILSCGLSIVNCPKFPANDCPLPEPMCRMIGHICPEFTVYLYNTRLYDASDAANLERVYLLLKKRCRIRAGFHQFLLVADKSDSPDSVLDLQLSATDEEQQVVKRFPFKTTPFDLDRLLPVMKLTKQFFRNDRNKVNFFDFLCSKIDELAYFIPEVFSTHCKFPKSDICWKSAPQKWHSIWFDLKSLGLPPELLDAGLTCSDMVADYGCGYTVFASQYKAKQIQITRLCKPLASLIDYEEEKVNVYYHSDSAVPLYDAGDTLFIINKKIRNLRLLDSARYLSLVKIQRFIEAVAQDLFYLDKTLRLSNFRPDTIFIDLDKDKAYYNTHIPSDNPCLPLLLADNRRVDPFHIYICEYQNDVNVKEKQTIYCFGWLVWILVEGSCNQLPDINAGQRRWLEQVEEGRFNDVPDYLVKIMVTCWNITTESWKNDWKDVLELIKHGVYESLFKLNDDVDAYTRLILEEGSFNSQDEEGVAPLHRFAYHGLADRVQELIDHGADVNVNNKKGSSPLHIASFDGKLEAAKTLLDNGADVNHRNKRGVTALMFASFKNHAELLRLLISRGAILDAEEENGFNSLHYASSEGHVEIVEILLKNGMPLNNSTKFRTTALQLAADKNHSKVVSLLLEHGALRDSQNQNGWSSLHSACCRGHTETATILIDNGASIDMATVKGFTPLYLACEADHVETARMLIERGANIDYSGKDGYTPLHICAELGNTRCCELLIEHGATVDARSSSGDTPLLRASYDGQADVVKLLLTHGADVDYRNSYGGWSSLHIACFNGHVTVVQALLRGNASLDIKNDAGAKPLDCCGNHTHIGRMIVDHMSGGKLSS